TGSTVRLDNSASEVSIGRHASRDIQVDDDRASRMHARVLHRAGRWTLEDCGSLNGTFVNSQPIQQSVLEPGDLIRVGDRLIMFVDNSPGDLGAGANGVGFRATTLIGRGPASDP